MCELALTKAQSEKRKVKSAKRKAKARFNAPRLCDSKAFLFTIISYVLLS